MHILYPLYVICAHSTAKVKYLSRPENKEINIYENYYFYKPSNKRKLKNIDC